MKNKILIFTIVIMLLLANLTIVQAATTATAILKVDKDKVQPGDTFTVTLSVTCEDGINGIDTTYTYDTDTLELVSANLKDSSKWSNLGSDNQITVICNSTSKITTADILVLTFKVKDTATVGTTASVSTTDILVDSDAATDSEKTVNALKTSITVETQSSNEGNETSGEGTGTEQEEQNNVTTGQETQGNTTTEQSNTTTKTDNTVTNASTLPKTGKSGIALVIVAILVVSVVFAYKKYDNYKGI